jgi:hypothetical protein
VIFLQLQLQPLFSRSTSTCVTAISLAANTSTSPSSTNVRAVHKPRWAHANRLVYIFPKEGKQQQEPWHYRPQSLASACKGRMGRVRLHTGVTRVATDSDGWLAELQRVGRSKKTHVVASHRGSLAECGV